MAYVKNPFNPGPQLRAAGLLICAASLLSWVTPLRAAESASQVLKPGVLADFEEAGSERAWQGLKCQRTDQHAASGRYGLRFEIPQWHESEEPRPGIRLPLGSERRPADLSQCSKIILEAWVEGDQPGKLGLKLRDAAGEDSWTTHITVEPKRWNRMELLMSDAKADCDLHRIKEVVLYALRATNSFALIVDHLRLEPAELPPLAQFHLCRPNYRGWIFPDTPQAEVEVEVAAEERGYRLRDLRLRLDLHSNDRSVQVEQRLSSETQKLSLSTLGMPTNDLVLTASLRSWDAELATQSWPLRALTPTDVAQLNTYIDGHQRLIVEGKPFFPLGWYGSVNESQLAEIADSPFNCLLAYGTDQVAKEPMTRFLDLMHKRGLKLMYCLNDVYPTATYLEGKDWEGVRGNDAIAAAIVAAYRNHPAVLGWYLNDEIPHALVPQLTDYYHRIQRADPGHPNFIVLCNRHEFPYFPETTDIFGVDPYPIPKEPVTRVADFVMKARAAVHSNQPVWLVPQAFAWYQYNSKNTDRGHAPTEEELRTGRAPTYQEERCMTYLGLVQGAKGLIYYCYYDMRVLPQYREMWSWMKSIASEVKTLSPALLSAESAGDLTVSSKNDSLQTALFRTGDTLYVLAVNPDKAPCRAGFDLRRKTESSAKVLFENRDVVSAKGRFEDNFAPLAVHVYAVKLAR